MYILFRILGEQACRINKQYFQNCEGLYVFALKILKRDPMIETKSENCIHSQCNKIWRNVRKPRSRSPISHFWKHKALSLNNSTLPYACMLYKCYCLHRSKASFKGNIWTYLPSARMKTKYLLDCAKEKLKVKSNSIRALYYMYARKICKTDVFNRFYKIFWKYWITTQRMLAKTSIDKHIWVELVNQNHCTAFLFLQYRVYIYEFKSRKLRKWVPNNFL